MSRIRDLTTLEPRLYRGYLAEDYDGIGQYVLVTLSGASTGAAYKARIAAGDFGGRRTFPVGTPILMHIHRGLIEILDLGNKPGGFRCEFVVDDFTGRTIQTNSNPLPAFGESDGLLVDWFDLGFPSTNDNNVMTMDLSEGILSIQLVGINDPDQSPQPNATLFQELNSIFFSASPITLSLRIRFDAPTIPANYPINFGGGTQGVLYKWQLILTDQSLVDMWTLTLEFTHQDVGGNFGDFAFLYLDTIADQSRIDMAGSEYPVEVGAWYWLQMYAESNGSGLTGKGRFWKDGGPIPDWMVELDNQTINYVQRFRFLFDSAGVGGGTTYGFELDKLCSTEGTPQE